jgi:hypothetical protein
MAVTKRPTFLKRQKEQQRLARAAEKREARAARRLARRAAAEEGLEPAEAEGIEGTGESTEPVDEAAETEQNPGD